MKFNFSQHLAILFWVLAKILRTNYIYNIMYIIIRNCFTNKSSSCYKNKLPIADLQIPVMKLELALMLPPIWQPQKEQVPPPPCHQSGHRLSFDTITRASTTSELVGSCTALLPNFISKRVEYGIKTDPGLSILWKEIRNTNSYIIGLNVYRERHQRLKICLTKG